MPNSIILTPSPDFERTSDALVETTGNATASAVRDLSAEVLWRIIMRTPVDTGAARGNWKVGLNEAQTSSDKNHVDPEGHATLEAGMAVLKNLTELENTDQVIISNSLPYINRLEHGWSKKAPNGMIGITAAEVPFLAAQIGNGFGARLHGSKGSSAAAVVETLGGGQ